MGVARPHEVDDVLGRAVLWEEPPEGGVAQGIGVELSPDGGEEGVVAGGRVPGGQTSIQWDGLPKVSHPSTHPCGNHVLVWMGEGVCG